MGWCRAGRVLESVWRRWLYCALGWSYLLRNAAVPYNFIYSDVLARLQVLEGPRGTSGQISTRMISVGFTILPFTLRSTSGVEVVEPLEPACSARPDFRAHPATRTIFSTPRITTSALLARDITIMLKHCSIKHHKRTLQRFGWCLHKLLNLVHTSRAHAS
jgi:hypothetical protein